MRTAIFSILAIMAIAIGATAVGISAQAEYLYQATESSDGTSS
jgi:hypothetical protein